MGTSVDDVHEDCYACVWANKQLGYYANWEPVVDVKIIKKPVATEQNLGAFLRNRIAEAEDQVNSPKHYTQGGIETIDYIRAKLGKKGTVAYCMGNVLKYTSRWQDKNGQEDLKKAQWYLNYAINIMDKECT